MIEDKLESTKKISRRSFLKGAFAGLGMLTISNLPPLLSTFSTFKTEQINSLKLLPHTLLRSHDAEVIQFIQSLNGNPVNQVLNILSVLTTKLEELGVNLVISFDGNYNFVLVLPEDQGSMVVYLDEIDITSKGTILMNNNQIDSPELFTNLIKSISSSIPSLSNSNILSFALMFQSQPYSLEDQNSKTNALLNKHIQTLTGKLGLRNKDNSLFVVQRVSVLSNKEYGAEYDLNSKLPQNILGIKLSSKYDKEDYRNVPSEFQEEFVGKLESVDIQVVYDSPISDNKFASSIKLNSLQSVAQIKITKTYLMLDNSKVKQIILDRNYQTLSMPQSLSGELLEVETILNILLGLKSISEA